MKSLKNYFSKLMCVNISFVESCQVSKICDQYKYHANDSSTTERAVFQALFQFHYFIYLFCFQMKHYTRHYKREETQENKSFSYLVLGFLLAFRI